MRTRPRQRSQEALALAQQIGHIPSLAYAEVFAARLCQSRRDAAATQPRADAFMALAAAHGFGHRIEHGRILRGWALAMQGDAAAGVAHIRQGLAAFQDTGPKLWRPYYLALLAEASGQAGQPEAGLTVLAEALHAGGGDRGVGVGGRAVSPQGGVAAANSRAPMWARRTPVSSRRCTWLVASRPRPWSSAPR